LANPHGEVASINRCKKQQLRAREGNRLRGSGREARSLNSHEVIAFDFSKQETAVVPSYERRPSRVIINESSMLFNSSFETAYLRF
jgi:hypothetical protein